MKKLIALIVTLSLITTMSLTSFATVTVKCETGDAITINATETAEGSGVYTYDEATTFTTTLNEESSVTSGNSQTTILAVAGYTGAGSINTSSIQYINQGTEKNFTGFALKDGITTGTVTILMGGDNMPETTPIATVATLTFATVDDEGGEDPNPDPDVPEVPEYTLGDVDGNGTINATDAGWVLSKYTNSSTVLPGGDLSADVDGNDTINATDAGWILSKYTNSSTVFPAESK